jgi:hypothetical protein
VVKEVSGAFPFGDAVLQGALFYVFADLGYAVAAVCFVHDAGVVLNSYLWFSLAARRPVIEVTA